MIVDNRFRKGDRVRIRPSGNFKEYRYIDGYETLKGAIGTIVGIDRDYEFLYEIKFEDEEVERLSNKHGGLLWREENLEFWFDWFLPKKVKLASENEFKSLIHSLELVKTLINKNYTDVALAELEEIIDSIEERLDDND